MYEFIYIVLDHRFLETAYETVLDENDKRDKDNENPPDVGLEDSYSESNDSNFMFKRVISPMIPNKIKGNQREIKETPAVRLVNS